MITEINQGERGWVPWWVTEPYYSEVGYKLINMSLSLPPPLAYKELLKLSWADRCCFIEQQWAEGGFKCV